MKTKADLVKLLKESVKFLQEPDHTGELLLPGENGAKDDWTSMPLNLNDCACELHRFHVKIRKALKALEAQKPAFPRKAVAQ